MPPRVVLISGNHLCHNPRVAKEATALSAAGFKVDILGAWSVPALKARDQAMLVDKLYSYTPVLDFAASTPGVALQRTMDRIRRMIARKALGLLGVERPALLGASLPALARAAASIPANLFIAHSEPALLAARALGARGRNVGVDMEDWFSEDLLPKSRSSRPVALLRDAERDLLRGGVYSTCPSAAMSGALATEFDCLPPEVIYNAFPWHERASLDQALLDRPNRDRPSIHWYSQTLGSGRGLEELLASLSFIEAPAELYLRGVPAAGFEPWLWERIPPSWRERVVLLPLVQNDSLLSRIAEHDIGFAGERTDVRSRDLTVTNKILHYLLGGLAVVASATSGQREVAHLAPGAVHLYPAGDVASLAASLNALLTSRDLLESSKRAALRAARETLCWESQEERLLARVDRALAR
ncbi:MAG: glycosyl transferase family 1 [Thermoanaerobaculia bacterium]